MARAEPGCLSSRRRGWVCCSGGIGIAANSRIRVGVSERSLPIIGNVTGQRRLEAFDDVQATDRKQAATDRKRDIGAVQLIDRSRILQPRKYIPFNADFGVF